VVAPPKQGKIVMTLRVELKKTMSTAILKVPCGVYFNKEDYMDSMQQWAAIPFHKRIIRPLCFASLNEDLPLVFVEDMPFCYSLEDGVRDRSFYKGFRYRFETSHRLLSCVIQVIDCLAHAHKSGIMHLNLHPGNILLPKCGLRDEKLGFFVTDFGDPLLLQEETVWSDLHEKTFQRLLKF